MDKKIIDAHRYKKVPRNKVKTRKNKNSFKIKSSTNNQNNIFVNSISRNNRYNNLKDNTLKEEKKQRVKEKIKKDFEYSKIIKIAICIFAIVAVVFISKLIFNMNENPLLSVFSNNDNTDESLIENYNFNIGISKLDTTDCLRSSNIVLNELAKKSSLSLIKINKEYKIEYKIAEKIEKLNDTSYLVTLNPIYKLTSDEVISSFNSIKNIGESNIYYNNLTNIKNIEKIDDNSFKIYLLANDPFFIYKLNFPINEVSNKNTEYIMGDVSQNSISFVKNTSRSTLGVIKLTNYTNTDEMVASFRNGDIDMFTASSDNIMQLIGKREYNTKKYRDGETIFLLGNSKSSLFKRKEVRQALAYAINRDEIVKNVDMKFSEVIDIPYIYSDIKYKYDLYAAENVLLLNGWKKTGGIYNKNDGYEYKKIELNLLVNKDDSQKTNIADSIKEMAQKIGIRINVLKLSEAEINTRVQTGDYDLVLSTVYINDSPDIEYLYNYLNVSDITNSAIENVKKSDLSNIEENVDILKNTLYSEVACIGIMAKTTNVVYQKYIKGFDNISYMNIFEELENIGRIKD